MRLVSLTRRTTTTRIGAVFAAIGFLSTYPAVNTFAKDVDCSDTDSALSYWRPIKTQIDTATSNANELALELIACLGSTNPELRDQIGYELFTHWLRNQALSDGTRAALLAELSAGIGETETHSALTRSFSALILAELMRSDTQQAFMSARQRADLLATAAIALENEDEYRGLDDDIGWIHPVAHMGDLLWRFALHPDTTESQALQILDAISTKVAPTATSYQFNESDRLARVVSTLIRRAIISDEEAEAWLGRFVSPKSMESWSDAFRTTGGMAELHNTKQFLRALSDQLDTEDIGEKTNLQLQMLVQGFTNLI